MDEEAGHLRRDEYRDEATVSEVVLPQQVADQLLGGQLSPVVECSIVKFGKMGIGFETDSYFSKYLLRS